MLSVNEFSRIEWGNIWKNQITKLPLWTWKSMLKNWSHDYSLKLPCKQKHSNHSRAKKLPYFILIILTIRPPKYYEFIKQIKHGLICGQRGAEMGSRVAFFKIFQIQVFLSNSYLHRIPKTKKNRGDFRYKIAMSNRNVLKV